MTNVNAWDFVEKNYPDYSSSLKICRNSDLCNLVEFEHTDSDTAKELLEKEYNNDINDIEIKIDYLESYVSILEKSIESFMKKQFSELGYFETAKSKDSYIVYGKRETKLCRVEIQNFEISSIPEAFEDCIKEIGFPLKLLKEIS